MAFEPSRLIAGTIRGRRQLALRLPARSREPWRPCRNQCLAQTDERGRLRDGPAGHLSADLGGYSWARYTENDGLVFCQASSQPIDPRNSTRYFERLLTQAGLPNIRFHDGRHTFATLMLELGESAKTVQTMLGHTKIAMTLDLYSHVSLDRERKAAERLNAVLRG